VEKKVLFGKCALLGVHHSADVTMVAHTHSSFIATVWFVYIHIIANTLSAALES
jgi:hypothetical protein